MAIIEGTEGRYEVQDGEFGKIYRWCPELVLVRCDCGEMTTLTESDTTCAWCGFNHASIIREELVTRWLEDEAIPPWRNAREREGSRILASASRS